MIFGVDKICWKMCFFNETWRVTQWIGRSGLVSARGDNSIPHENLNAEREDKKLWTSETAELRKGDNVPPNITG